MSAVVILCVGFIAPARAQQRSQGVSLHMLPKRVADLTGSPWGFTVDPSPRLRPESQRPVFQTVSGVLAFVREQDEAVQQNGLWIVITDPDAYSDDEKNLLDQVKFMCRREKIPLFICRASQLPNGWTRADR